MEIKMSEYFFGLGPGHLPEEINELDVLKEERCILVNYVEPGTRYTRHWFAGPNRGNPFDQQMADRVLEAVDQYLNDSYSEYYYGDSYNDDSYDDEFYYDEDE